jgi:hypothetical protein
MTIAIAAIGIPVGIAAYIFVGTATVSWLYKGDLKVWDTPLPLILVVGWPAVLLAWPTAIWAWKFGAWLSQPPKPPAPKPLPTAKELEGMREPPL